MLFCRHCGLDPEALVRLDSAKASGLCQDFTDYFMDKSYSIRYVNVSQAYLKTFFKENGFTGEKELKVERYHQPTRYRKKLEYIPTPKEIYKMGYAGGSAKNRAMIFALYTSGLRNSTLRALRCQDVKKELESGLNVVKIPIYPEMKKIDPAACKGDIPYYTFIDPETVKALREYLEERKKHFGSIIDEEPLFCSDSNQISKVKQRNVPVSKNGLERVVKRAARKAGIEKWTDVTPKCLRKAYESTLRNNRLDPKDQEFLMGHILPGTQDPYYDYSSVEDLRGKYSGLIFFKTTEVDKLEMIKAFAQTLGIDKIEVKIRKMREKQSELDEIEALGRIMREELGIKPLRTKTVKYKKNVDLNKNDCPKFDTKIVSENQLVPYLNEGWDIVRELKNTKIVIRRSLAPSDLPV